jgi:hypothetical protein
VDKIPQGETELAGDVSTVPVVGYFQGSGLVYGAVWIATASGIAQQGMLNQNIAYVFINGSGIYVQAILLKDPLGWWPASKNYTLLMLKSLR